jgi:hypothetical protein
MKNFPILVVLFILVFSLSSKGQIDDIKKKSRENKKGNSSGNKSEPGISSGRDSDPCAASCAEACFDVFFSVAFQALIEHHAYLLKSRDIDPTVVSLDIQPHFAYGPDNDYINFLPRIRGTWGVFSTDFRLNYLAEYKDYTASLFKIAEWQVLQINITPVPEFSLRFGSGAYFENFTDSVTDPITQVKSSKRLKNVFNEQFISVELRMNEQQFITTLEGRYAADYSNGNHVFSEINFRTNFRFIRFDHIAGYLMAGLVYQKYYDSIDLWSIQTGLSFNIH